jgi:hypothetical protein
MSCANSAATWPAIWPIYSREESNQAIATAWEGNQRDRLARALNGTPDRESD